MTIKFADLNLDKNILSALQAAGYDSTTPIQAQSIPAALAGKDIMASAQTGSGKTAAFLLPSLQKIVKRSEKPGKGPRVLVLTPTRELAAQVEKNAQIYAKNMKWVRSVTLVGGSSFGQQIKAMSKPIDIIVATPGRLMDHMRSGRVDFDRLEVLILDEADRKIDEQLLYCDDKNHKHRLLEHILRDASIDQCVIFTSTKAMTEVLADELYEKGFAANCLHGDMPQGWRNRTLMDLRKGRCKILVATDVAARGIDVPTITHVINYDLPKQAEDYVHRIGRTGRAGRSGLAISFAEVNEYMAVHKIERYIGRKLPEVLIEGLEPTRKRNKNAERKPRGKGGFGGKREDGRWGKGGNKKSFGDKHGGFKKDGAKREGGFKKDGFKAKPKNHKPHD